MNPNEIATIVRYCRKQSGLTQQALGKIAGVGKTVIFDIEKGKETVQLNSLLKVFAVLSIEMQLKTPFTDLTGSEG